MFPASRFFVVACALVPSVALAHPGHGSVEASSVLHYLTEPLHAVALVVAVGGVAVVVYRRRRRARAE